MSESQNGLVIMQIQGSRIPLSLCPGKVKSTSGIVQKKSALTRRESHHMPVLILE